MSLTYDPLTIELLIKKRPDDGRTQRSEIGRMENEQRQSCYNESAGEGEHSFPLEITYFSNSEFRGCLR